MTSQYEEIYDKWLKEEPIYNELGLIIQNLLKNFIYENEMYADVSFRTKEIVSILKKLKKKNENVPYNFNDLTDKLGVRIICNYKEDITLIDKIILENFSVKKFEDKAEKLSHDVFSYTSFHYDLIYTNYSDEIKNKLVFELQLRTINQHAWACTAHELSYKQEIELPNILKRKVHRLVALYEIADDELSSVNNYILTHENYSIFNLFKKLEKKFYKLAKHPFDRNQSIITLKQIISFLTNEEMSNFNILFDEFMSSNSNKIATIYSEYKMNPRYNFIILQPEVIFIWFLLVNFEFSINDNWLNYFDENDLEIIKSVWGDID